jgi:hypothetical protein
MKRVLKLVFVEDPLTKLMAISLAIFFWFFIELAARGRLATPNVIEREVEIIATLQDVVGSPKNGFRVKQLIVRPAKVLVRVSGDRKMGPRKLHIEKVDVSDRDSTFTVPGKLRGDIKADLLESFIVEVIIEEYPQIRFFMVPVYVNAPLDIPLKPQIDPQEIGIDLEAPRETLDRLLNGREVREIITVFVTLTAKDIHIDNRLRLPVDYRWLISGFQTKVKVTLHTKTVEVTFVSKEEGE